LLNFDIAFYLSKAKRLLARAISFALNLNLSQSRRKTDHKIMDKEKTDDANIEKKGEEIEDETSKKNEEEETSKNETSQDAEETEGEEEEKVEDEKKDEEEKESPYEQKLKEMEEEAEKDDVILRQKDGAIKEERKKRKEAEAKLREYEGEEEEEAKPLTKEEIDEMLTERDKKIVTKIEIEKISKDETEKKLIEKIVNSKGVSVADAKILANAHKIEEFDRKANEESQREESQAELSAGISRGVKGEPAYNSDAVKKAAADGLTPEERKYL